jgi:hypothetical protein
LAVLPARVFTRAEPERVRVEVRQASKGWSADRHRQSRPDSQGHAVPAQFAEAGALGAQLLSSACDASCGTVKCRLTNARLLTEYVGDLRSPALRHINPDHAGDPRRRVTRLGGRHGRTPAYQNKTSMNSEIACRACAQAETLVCGVSPAIAAIASKRRLPIGLAVVKTIVSGLRTCIVQQRTRQAPGRPRVACAADP